MTGREWKPGEVAIDPEYRTGIAFVVQYGEYRCPPNHETHERHIHYSDGDWNAGRDAMARLRPAIVLDLSEQPSPTDPARRTEAHHLIDMLRETAENFFVPDAADLARRVADQIEAQVGPRKPPKPPKPDEPTGLGAVVEDAEGVHWVLYTHPDSTCPWVSAETSVDYADIAAVRVLSEGVQS